MSRCSFLFILLSLCFSQYYLIAQSNQQFEQSVIERNKLYNELQLISLSDTLTPMQKLDYWRTLIQLDNELIDEWIPYLLQQNDSLREEKKALQQKMSSEIEALKNENFIYLLVGIGLTVISVLFIIISIIQFTRKRKFKKQFLQAKQAERDRDAFKTALEDKIAEVKHLQQQNHELTLLSQRQSDELHKIKLQTNAELSEAKKQIEQLEQQLSIYEKEIEKALASKDKQIEDLNQVITELNLFKQSIPEDIHEKLEKLSFLENEQKKYIKETREQEQLIADFRRQIHDLRTLLDEKERDNDEKRFSEIATLHDEIRMLKQRIREQMDLIEDYRTTLEKELDLRKEMEDMLKDLLK